MTTMLKPGTKVRVTGGPFTPNKGAVGVVERRLVGSQDIYDVKVGVVHPQLLAFYGTEIEEIK